MHRDEAELLIEHSMRRAEIVRNYRKFIPKILSAIRETLGDAKVYLFGSVVEGKVVGGSDVDIMIVADVEGNMKKAEIIAKIEEKAGLPFDNPFEFHLLTPEEFERWKRIFKPKLVKL